MRLDPSLEAVETLGEDERPRRGLALLETATGAITTFEEVSSFGFSADGGTLVYHRLPPGEEEGGEGEAEGGDGSEAGRGDPGSTLVVRSLASGAERTFEGVRSHHLHPDGSWLAFVRGGAAGSGATSPGLVVLGLDDAAAGGVPVAVHEDTAGRYESVAWRDGSDGAELVFVFARQREEGDPEPTLGSLMHWQDGDEVRTLVSPEDAPDGWVVPAAAPLRWGMDGEAVFFGWRPRWPFEMQEGGEAAGGEAGPRPDEGDFDPYDLDAILEGRGVDVWHWDDPFIMPQQKVRWSEEKDRTYWAVHHLDERRTVQLADPEVPQVVLLPPGSDDDGPLLARSDVPYRVERTWAGNQYDLWLVDAQTGERTRVADRLRDEVARSPGGRYVIFWREGAYHLYDGESGSIRNLTADWSVPMADEDHDYPNPASGYGVAGWLDGDRAVLLYDKYDIWRLPLDGGGEPVSLTGGAGREQERIFRILNTDDDRTSWSDDEDLLLLSYHDKEKNYGFYRASTGEAGVERLLEEPKRFQFIAAAEDADVLLYSREAYDEFPDLWVAGDDLSDPERVTELNPQLQDFGWGSAELTEWESLDGTPLQGVVIKPRGYVEGRRYPVLVYYYRFFSQRLHEFNDPSVNHRPSFPVYASDGYVVFLPDVRFEVGRPGFAATKSVVPGVQHLVDIGLADPDAVALHGHSWSGYQTAFIVTQTDLFATAVAGAPVGNMTSAYSGIRLGSGLARQFQYEQGQSRLSGSLWESRDEYIDNSPIFFADQVDTPLLILHGDEDDAVPWEQSIELYLALRRLGKETVFLQYRGEPHHPQRYANKLDWALRMKEWVDHYTKGVPAPAWITEGVPYRGR
jgi:dipeptidyl aminopeptidase/acylaminoacyl peptidase